MRLVLSVFTIAAATMAAPGRVWAGPEENKAVVLGYEDMIFHQHKVAEGIEKYVAPNYVQHSPEVPPGKQGLSDRMSGPNSVIMQPGRHHDVIKVIAAGDEVVTFAHSYKDGERGTAVVDWFRVKDGKIVEHWDILQPVPENSLAGGSMFDVIGK